MSQANSESYPPVFRRKNQGVDSDEPTKLTPDSDPLPVIDLQCINYQQLHEVCTYWGMFRLVNHGIPLILLNQLQDQAKQIFSLSFESKQALFTSPISYFWGTSAVTPSGVALQRGPQNINWVEGFNCLMGQLSTQHQAGDSVLDSFRLVLEEYGKHQSRIATTIFEAMAENLKLDPKNSKSYVSAAAGLLRVYRYPRCPVADQAWGIDVHTDSSVLSILSQDRVGGLQVYNDDKWLDVKPISNTLVVNLGDMMQAMSDDKYLSVKHRVKVNKQKERISIGCFVFPAEDAVIQSSRYKPFTYADFRAQVQQDLKATGFKVGLPRFKLPQAC